MSRAEITLADVTALEQALIAAKQTSNVEAVRVAKEALAPVRQAYRLQEEAAGRRSLVGGDAQKVEGT